MSFGYLQAMGAGGVGMATKNFHCAKHSLASSVYYKSDHSWACKKRSNEGSQKARKCYFQISVYKYSECFLLLYVLSTLVQVLRSFNSSKITYFGRCNNPILPEFSQASKVWGVTPTPPGRNVPGTVLLFNLYCFHFAC